MKYTVKEYASACSISVQAVYQQISKGLLNVVEKNGRKVIIADKIEIKEVEQALEQPLKQDLIKQLFKQLKSKDKEIKRLHKKLEKCGDAKEKVYLSYINELKQLQITHQPEEIIEVKADKKKKKKKK